MRTQMKKPIAVFLAMLLSLLLPVGVMPGFELTAAAAATTWDYGYSGGEQTFTAPVSDYYKLEVWGAQGGTANAYRGGYGGYAVGSVWMDAGTTIYIYVGGAGGSNGSGGATLGGGYNGGGTANGNAGVNHVYGSGGGATHIAYAQGLLTSRASDYGTNLLIAAGGGGGGRWQPNYADGQYGVGGSGGGATGQNAFYYAASSPATAAAGTQSGGGPGGTFGQGASASAVGTGGGGFYGGGYGGSGSGGSGYLNPALVSVGCEKHMAVFDDTGENYNNTNPNIKTVEVTGVGSGLADAAQTGHGYARISRVSTQAQYFGYSGGVQQMIVPYSGYYLLETWGAQGGSTSGYHGGYGAYSIGVAYLTAGQTLYAVVGGEGCGGQSGTGAAGGYNGGGSVSGNSAVNHCYGSGGGATHIALAGGILADRAGDYTSTVLIAAGGGGGARWQENYNEGCYGHGGSGGGVNGQNAFFYAASNPRTVAGATQTSPGSGASFGRGGSANAAGAGGGGLYGGGSSVGDSSPGSGGSGYLNPALFSYKNFVKHMAMFDDTSTDYNNNDSLYKTIETTAVSSSPVADQAKSGAGFAGVKLISTVVSLDDNGGAGGSGRILYPVDEPNGFEDFDGNAVASVAVPTRTGYTFGGYAAPDGTVLIDETGAISESLVQRMIEDPGCGTLTAVWTANTYTVTLSSDEADTHGTESITATFDEMLSEIDPPAKTGYTFEGYFAGENGEGTKYYNSDGTGAAAWDLDHDETLRARFDKAEYSVILDGNGATGGEMAALPEVYDEPDTLPEVAYERTGYTFAGWNTKSDGSGDAYADKAEILNLTSEDGDAVRLYAQWTANKYNVVFKNFDGTVLQEGLVAFDATPAYTGEVPAKASDTINNYVFSAWSPEVARITTVPDGDIVYTAEFSATNHAFDAGVVHAPTCEADGYITYTCADCGYVLDVRTGGAIGHDWDMGETVTPATCTEEGEKTFTCGNCGETKTETIPAKGHTVVQDAAVPATCTSTGLTAGAHCDVCGTVFAAQEETAKLPHSFTNYVYNSDATCTANGTETAVCDNCTATDTRVAANTKLDHSFTTYEYNNDATCLANGTETAICDNCTATDTREASGTKLDHVFSEDDADWEIITQATCTAYGAKKTLCTLCGVATKTAPIDPTGEHSFVKVRTVAATCVNAGYDEYICSVCGLTEQRNVTEINAANHAKDPILVGKRDATETEDGYSGDLICPACGETITAGHVEPKTAVPHEHDFATLISHADATCAAKAYDIYACVCGETKKIETGEVNPDNHAAAPMTVGQRDASATEYGYTGDVICPACDKVLSVGEVIEKTVVPHVHSFDTVIESGEATCIAKAYTVKQCACGETERTETGTLNADNHAGNIILVGAREATATMGGYTGDKICTACGATVETGTFTAPTDPGHTHDYAEIVETAEATCVAKAYTIYQCACGDTKKVETGSVDPANHAGEIKTYGAHEATDTLDGYTGDKVCAACGKVVEAGSVIPHTGSTTPDTPTNPDTPDDGGSNSDTRISFLDWLRNLIKKILALFNFGGEGFVC